MARNSVKLSEEGRSRCGQAYRGFLPSPPPLWSTISSSRSHVSILPRNCLRKVVLLVQWQTYARPFWTRASASSYNRSKLSLECVTLAGLKPSHRTVSSMDSSNSFFSPAGFVSSKRRLHTPPWYLANPKLMAIALLCPMCNNPFGSGGTAWCKESQPMSHSSSLARVG